MMDPQFTPVVTAWIDIAGTDTPVDITSYCRSISITRGRTTAFGDIPAGTCTILAHNYTRDLDPGHTASPYYGKLVPGKKIQVQVLNAPIFSGHIQDWDYTYDVEGVSYATVTAVDYLATLAKKTFTHRITPAWSETTGERMINLLAEPEVDMLDDAHIDTGVSTLQADIVDVGTNALTYLQLLARTDVGRLYAAGQAWSIMFRDRNHVLGLVDVLTVSDAPGADSFGTKYLPFSEVDVKVGSDVLYTQVIVSRVDGSTETFTDDDAAAAYGIQSTGSEYTGLLLEDDTQSYDIGLMLIGVYAQPIQQFSRFLIHVERLGYAEVNALTFTDIGQLVRGIFTPDKIGAPIDQFCIVEGVRHDISPGQHTVELYVSYSLSQDIE